MKYITNPKIVAEEFDSEIILIDIERGLYFTLGGIAVDLWRIFSTPFSVEDLCSDRALINLNLDSAVIPEMINKLLDNNLFIEVSDSDEPNKNVNALALTSASAPTLHIYSDLAELIAIDPVHEVDASLGWPVRHENFPELN